MGLPAGSGSPGHHRMHDLPGAQAPGSAWAKCAGSSAHPTQADTIRAVANPTTPAFIAGIILLGGFAWYLENCAIVLRLAGAAVGGPWRVASSGPVLNQGMLSLPEISDRLEIQQLLVDYSTAIDQRRFDDLDKVFTPDAYIDYRALGGIDGRYPEVKEWLSKVLPSFPVYAHMLGNFSVRIDGDTASSRVICFNPMVLPGDKDQVLFCGLWYDDEFVRTPEGWRMTRRVESKVFQKVM
jgi:hypothetical protein